MNWGYFIIVCIICLPGIIFMYRSEKIHLKENDVTDKQRLASHFLTVILFSMMGAYIVPRIFIDDQLDISRIFLFGFGLGVICSIGHLVLYYKYLVPRITKTDYIEIEAHYANTGILSRVFYGGVLEEVMFRWGLLSLFIWLSQLMGIDRDVSIIAAILVSSILFAMIHLPSITLIASQPKSIMYVYTIVGNVWVGIFAGIAFIQGGLLAAIFVHMLFHLLWWPIQSQESNKLYKIINSKK